MHDLLPLSWTTTESLRPLYRHIPLPLSGRSWITYADVPSCFSRQILYDDIVRTFPSGYVIRGCVPELGGFLSARKCHVMRTGAEAVLEPGNPVHLQRKTVQASLARGKKHGLVREMMLDDENRLRFEAFRNQTSHAGKPQLRNLFRDDPASGCRCFVFHAFSGEWLAAMTLSVRSRHALHTELMLRHRNAPGDIMECLVAGILEILSLEGWREWSLGEVPFMPLMQHDQGALSFIERLMITAVSNCRHVYDFEGLYRFKNKFVPVWRPVMLCTDSEPTPFMLVDLSNAMGFTGLLVNESFSLVRQWVVPV